VTFQRDAGLQGRQFSDQCDFILERSGYLLGGHLNLAEIGVEIDREATSPNGTIIWFEYKGSLQGRRPGLIRTDTLKKAIANGALLPALAQRRPYVVLTSHLPVGGSASAMLTAALNLHVLDDVICIYDPADASRLKRL
jgi:hypothetical protein